jgi:hypothetical protein
MIRGLTERSMALFALQVTIQSTEDPDDRDLLEEVLLLADLGVVRVGLLDGELTFTPGPTLLDGGPIEGPIWN